MERADLSIVRRKGTSKYVKKLLKGKKVLFEYYVQKYHPYGKTLAYAYLEDNTFLNAHLLEIGLARLVTYPPNVRYLELLKIKNIELV